MGKTNGPKLTLYAGEVTYTRHPTIEVVHPDGWTQLFDGLPAFVYRGTVLTEGEEAALAFARTELAQFALAQYYPVKGHVKPRVMERKDDGRQSLEG